METISLPWLLTPTWAGTVMEGDKNPADRLVLYRVVARVVDTSFLVLASKGGLLEGGGEGLLPPGPPRFSETTRVSPAVVRR